MGRIRRQEYREFKEFKTILLHTELHDKVMS